MDDVLKRFYFVIEQTEGGEKTNCVVEFRSANLDLAKQEYEEVLGWYGGYKVLQIIERKANEPLGSSFLINLLVPSSDS